MGELGRSQEALEAAERLVKLARGPVPFPIDSKREAKRKVLFDRTAFPNETRSPGMRTYAYRYPVKLSEEQRRLLETMVHTSRTPAKHYLVARVLLMSDQRQGQPEATDSQIAEALSMSRRTVIRIKQRFVQENLEVALTGSFPREHPERRCLDGKSEANLIHLACSQSPDGRQRWNCWLSKWCDWATWNISARKQSGRRLKNELKPWLKKSWCFPKEADGDFVYHMEDVLDVYCQPYDPAVPRICMDEMGKNLVKDMYPPEPAKPGQVAREDYTFEKEGRANLFIVCEPLVGKRCLKVTEHRTKQDLALFMR
jgi:hypothetical protein